MPISFLLGIPSKYDQFPKYLLHFRVWVVVDLCDVCAYCLLADRADVKQ